MGWGKRGSGDAMEAGFLTLLNLSKTMNDVYGLLHHWRPTTLMSYVVIRLPVLILM